MRASRARRGFALILTLMLIALVTCIVVAFFASIHTETRASGSNSAARVAEHLAELAVQIVQGQIQQATTRGAAFAWASQPGMIRTYDSTGAEVEGYKLYSADSMTKAANQAVSDVLASDVPTAGWAPGAAN